MLEVSKSQNKAINIILQHKLPESKHRIEVKCTDESSGIFKVDKDRKKLTKPNIYNGNYPNNQKWNQFKVSVFVF